MNILLVKNTIDTDMVEMYAKQEHPERTYLMGAAHIDCFDDSEIVSGLEHAGEIECTLTPIP